MTGDSHHEEPATASAGPDLSDGRYLYCVVGIDGSVEAAPPEIDGVDEEPVSMITTGETPTGVGSGEPNAVGAIVHACTDLYDTADPRLVRRWLVQHQRVVDATETRFGTPIPFQFDTILQGGDDGVKQWLKAERDVLGEALADVAGRQEYRIDVLRTDPIPASTIASEDHEIAALEAQIDDASDGRAHLLRKQFETKVAARRRERDRRLATDLADRIDGLVSECSVLDPRPSITLEDGSTDGDGTERDGSIDGREETGEVVCRFAVLASEAAVDELGSFLDSVADRDGLTVRFTGPWPPYSFVPSFESVGDDREVS